ncbi:MAG: hypothetical protein RLY69_729 [Verrucomicrobiota bacterium]
MILRRHVLRIFLSALCLSLGSCATRPTTTASAANQKPGIATKLKKISVAKLPKIRMPGPFFEPDVKVVEPRVKDLKNLPSGSELAEAHRKKQRGFFWIVGGPVDFKEPDLPTPGIDVGEGLLPPLPP